MKQFTIYKRDFSIGKFHLSILNFEFPRYRICRLPKRMIVDIYRYQFWLSWI